jgi:membrane protein YdbS with pleckstrin-like domain
VAISRRLLNEGETVVVDTRTHIKALLWPAICLVLLLAIGTYAQTRIDDGTAMLVIWVVLAAGIVWFVLRPLVVWATATYTVTDRRLITRRGVVIRRGHDIPLARISDVAYEFGPIDRLLGCGTLIVSDASTHGRVRLHDIPRVEETQRTLNRLLQDVHDATAGHEGI